ncbi:MAG: glycoside hydrolase family 127 protein [Verrucomicrobia bacterium]|nr:glycoside hydrolase family 127 protein [Verrucomicrobiota bacterium]
MTITCAAAVSMPLAGAAVPVPDKVPCAVADKQDFQQPDRVHLTGWIGSRIEANERNRLVKMDPNRLLISYRKRPGGQEWDGEHVGKWLHAATLAWVYTGDPELREKLDYTATELVKCQLADGYLGTYTDNNRWTDWDVWAHKYSLLGLVTYIRHTGNMEVLPACRKLADLLCKTFGDEPGKRDLVAGHHVGMAPGSVLEPMVLLYRLTGEPRYLDFAKYVLRAYEQPNGPKIVSRLLELKRVDKVGNGKAYEMLSCINGILEMYRTTGDPKLLEACRNAWQDIVDKRLYITGGASYGEIFHDDFDLPNVNNVGETCVTTTWLQFNAQLLRLTGEARFAEQLERVVLNQLLGAQKPDGSAWGYYVQMEGTKPYRGSIDGHCCLSSGPRGVALIPTFASSVDADGVVVNLYDAGTAKLTLRDGKPVMLTTETIYPSDGKIVITVDTGSAAPFTFKARIPAWCRESTVKLNGKAVDVRIGDDGYAAIKRTWAKGDKVELNIKLEPRVIAGDHKNEGKAAVMYGPLVLAADEALPGTNGLQLNAVSMSTDLTVLAIAPEPAPDTLKSWPHAQVFRLNAVTRGVPKEIRLIPFADAGSLGENYKVWLFQYAGSNGDLLLEGSASRSRQGNADGSINDGNVHTYVVTYDGQRAAEDWYAVTLEEPLTIVRVLYAHGKTFHDGGWFDASAGKPRIQVQTSKGGAWENAGELKDYPATTAASAGALREGDGFNCTLAAPVKVFGVRVIGKPACGDDPKQAFSSCGDLQAFEK